MSLSFNPAKSWRKRAAPGVGVGGKPQRVNPPDGRTDGRTEWYNQAEP